MGKKKSDKASMIQARVRLRAASIGEETAAIGFEIARNIVDVDLADEELVGARIDVALELADEEGQGKLFDGGAPTLAGIADCNRISVGTTTIAGRLTFRKGDVKLDALAALAGREALMRTHRVGDAGEDKDKSETEAA